MSFSGFESQFRAQWAALARNRGTRCVGGIGRRHRWYPERVPDPETGFGMTDAAAWALLARLLEDSSIRLDKVDLDNPPNAVGWAMKVQLSHLAERIYLKFEFIYFENRNVICGRSFHLEDPR